MRDETHASAVVGCLCEVAGYVLTFVTGAGRDRKIGVCVSCSITGAAQIRAVNRAVQDLGVRAKAVEWAAWTEANSAVWKLEFFACVEFLHNSLEGRRWRV